MPRQLRRARKQNSDKPERLSIRDVARLAEVSIATVSRTINNVPTVDPSLAKRVRETIRQLGYFPDSQARALVSGRSHLLGLVISEITNPFFPELIQGFQDVAVEEGYEVLIACTNHDPVRTKMCIRRLVERKAEGVAVMTFGAEQSLLHQLADRNIPLVFVDVGPERPGVSILCVDYHQGILQGVEHLRALGHRDIAFVSGPLREHSAQSRLTAFRQSLRECGLQVNEPWILNGDHRMEGGIAAAEHLIGLKKLPTAIMCSNDMLAIGVLHKFFREGIRVPGDVSLIGFDDIHMAQMMIPPLTSVRMSRTDLARCAVAALRAHVEHTSPLRGYGIGTQLVVRESTSSPKDAVHSRHTRQRRSSTKPAARNS